MRQTCTMFSMRSLWKCIGGLDFTDHLHFLAYFVKDCGAQGRRCSSWELLSFLPWIPMGGFCRYPPPLRMQAKFIYFSPTLAPPSRLCFCWTLSPHAFRNPFDTGDVGRLIEGPPCGKRDPLNMSPVSPFLASITTSPPLLVQPLICTSHDDC